MVLIRVSEILMQHSFKDNIFGGGAYKELIENNIFG